MTTKTYIMSPGEIEKMYRKAMLEGMPTGINCGIENIDECFRLDRGKLVVATGIPNMGKSEFIDFLCVQYNKLYGMKTLFFSPENQPIFIHIDKLYRKFVGARFDSTLLDDDYTVAVRKYIYENFLFFNYNEEYTPEKLMLIAEQQVYLNGIDILVIDSHNKLLHDTSRNETDVISRELDMLERAAKSLNIIIILVAHPRKMEKKGDVYAIPSAYDINGSSNFFNKADILFAVHRIYEPNYTIIKVDKVKTTNYGGQGTIELGYDTVSGNYYSIPAFDTLGDSVSPPPKREAYNLNTHIRSGDQWLDVTCTYSHRVYETTVTECNLWKFLTTSTAELQSSLGKIRATGDKSKQQEYKAKYLPVITPSVLTKGKRDSNNIVSYTNIICLDIDKKDNVETIGGVLDKLKTLPYVAVAQKSASGEGYCVFVPIKYGDQITEHYQALEEDFAKMGITLDKACKDAVRARYYSYDEERYVNPACTVYVKRVAPSKPKTTQTFVTTSSTPIPKFSTPTVSHTDWKSDLNEACLKVKGCNVCDTHEAWIEVGSALAKELGEQGRSYYHTLSEGHPTYSVEETNDKYDELLKHADKYGYNKGTIFHHIKRAMQIA